MNEHFHYSNEIVRYHFCWVREIADIIFSFRQHLMRMWQAKEKKTISRLEQLLQYIDHFQEKFKGLILPHCTNCHTHSSTDHSYKIETHFLFSVSQKHNTYTIYKKRLDKILQKEKLVIILFMLPWRISFNLFETSGR